MEEKALPFLAVGRVRDQIILATFCEMVRGQAQTEDIFKRLLEASKAKLAPGQRQRLQWGNGSVCCLLDMQGESLYCLITAQMEYPERLAYQLLNELNQHVYQNHGQELTSSEAYALNRPLQPFMEKLIRQYEDPKSFDRICMLTTKTNVVRSVMQDSVRKVVETGESLQELEAKAGRMSEQSRQFSTTSREVRRHFWWKNKKLCIAGVLVLAFVVVVLVFSLRDSSSKKPEPKPKVFRIVMDPPQEGLQDVVHTIRSVPSSLPTKRDDAAAAISSPAQSQSSSSTGAAQQRTQQAKASETADDRSQKPANSILLMNRTSAPSNEVPTEAVFMIDHAHQQAAERAIVERGPLVDAAVRQGREPTASGESSARTETETAIIA